MLPRRFTVFRWVTIALVAPVLLGLIVLMLSARPALYANYSQSSAYFAAGGELLSLRLAADQSWERHHQQQALKKRFHSS
jgi:penicillin-binding protein 1C